MVRSRISMFAVAVLAFVAYAQPAGAAFPGENGKIAFEHAFDIETIGANGKHRSKPLAQGESPSFSADGRRIAFTLPGGGLAVMKADGSNTRTIFASDDAFEPAFSPDSNRIVFSYADLDASPQIRGIYTINTDGSGMARLTDGDDRSPQFSPDGTHIVFTRWMETTDGSSSKVFTMASNGSSVTQLTDGPYDDRAPDFSPDGRRIAFERNPRSTRRTTIALMRSDGSDLTEIDNKTAGRHSTPAFSPDGRFLTFSLSLDAGLGPGGINAALAVMKANGTRERKIYTGPLNRALNRDPSWQPRP